MCPNIVLSGAFLAQCCFHLYQLLISLFNIKLHRLLNTCMKFINLPKPLIKPNKLLSKLQKLFFSPNMLSSEVNNMKFFFPLLTSDKVKTEQNKTNQKQTNKQSKLNIPMQSFYINTRFFTKIIFLIVTY